MSKLRFLRDRVGLIVIYMCNLLIINLIIILDENNPMNINNVFYMDILSAFIIIVYLVYDYRKYNDIYKKIDYKIKHHYFEEFDITGTMPYIKKKYYQLFNEFYRTVNTSKQQLNKDNDEYYDFITSWVHAVKIPISASRLLIESHHNEADTKETLANIENEIEKIERYVEQTLYYSRSMSFSKDYLIQEYKLNNIVNKCVKKFAKTFIVKRVSLNVNMDKEISIFTDKKWFEFVLEQLISNALKYTDMDTGKIDISSYEDDREYRLLIRDNGVGIKIEDINRVFERGFTGFNGRYYEKSTGMGLYLARKLARKLGHKITIESKTGEYTLARIHVSKVGDYFLR
ncbi:sensor histidine kinase [Vallitalea longa]|uniref:histidine kinase n=1 Tax=Vallitalea longa TaxID=2936439 RepID=A0A9W5YB39_9FIRM|nr:sensor histidine kinase [Vallitalea longa]GKX29123.1 sensor histidine kinase [Vallitalea longa]